MSNGLIDQPLNDLAIRIKTARKEARLSQQALAEGIGLSDKAISSYEQGRSVPPFSKLKHIAEVTNHPISYFTDDNTDFAAIATKLLHIERELQEVKRLIKKAKQP